MSGRQTRRRYLATLGVAGAAALAGCSNDSDNPTPTGGPSIPESVGRWPSFGYDTANTGAAADETGPTANVIVQWGYPTGKQVFSSPAIVDGSLYIGSNDGYVYCLSAVDGTRQWRLQTGG
ncbi:PQQ-binding-like beta-propeller repeat protein [Halomicroarcula sp. GCM10025894]